VGGFPPGRAVALRNVWDGRVVSARAATVVRDDPGVRTLYVPIGAPWRAPVRPDGTALRLPTGEWSLQERRWESTHVLSFAWPERPHAVLLFWDRRWRPRCWYVNLQSPLRPTATGFDYADLILDAVIAPDRASWEWKDEDELAEAIGLGLLDAPHVERLRAEGERVVRRVLDRAAPFERDWWDWRPDPGWPGPALPPD
jgi:hypothetical protein